MESILGNLFLVSLAALLLFRLVAAATRAARGGPGRPEAPREGDPYADLARRAQETRRRMEEERARAEQDAGLGAPAPGAPISPEEGVWSPAQVQLQPTRAAPPSQAAAGPEARPSVPSQPPHPRGRPSGARALLGQMGLRRAVLAREILLPPLGLRPPSEGL